MPAGEDPKTKLSVIVPMYNASAYIAECIESLLAQTLDDIEIVVIDDGSSDDSREIVEQYLDSGSVILRQNPDKGVSAARNLGLSLARGEYVGFVDADDTVSPRMYEALYEQAEAEDADMVICGRVYVYEDGETVERLPKVGDYDSSIFENINLLSGTTQFVWDKIYRRSIIERNDIHFPVGYCYAEDCHFLTRYKVFARRIVAIPEALYYYRVKGGGSITGSFDRRILDIPRVLEDLIVWSQKMGHFAYMERGLWRISVGYFLRRIDDFALYSDRALQVEFFDAYYRLFEEYFWDWKRTIVWSGAAGRVSARLNAYRASRPLMLLYIHTPNRLKKAAKRLGVLAAKVRRIRKAFRTRRPALLYARYRKRKPVAANSVLFASYYGSSISDSQYYMMRDLLNRTDLDVYVASNDIHRDTVFVKFNRLQSPRLKLVRTFSKEYLEALATAKWLVLNSRFPSYFAKRPEQVCLNTWHGTPLKTLGAAMSTGISDLGNNQSQFLMADYLLFPNEHTKNRMMEDFFLDDLYAGTALVAGYPRNSPLASDSLRDEIRHGMGLDSKRVCVYMPTWRGSTLDTRNIQSYQGELAHILEELDARLEDNVVVFVKLHQLVAKKIQLSSYRHIRAVHPLYETNQFLTAADCLITDYSSVLFDFANTRREIILFTYDLDNYIEERGTYLDVESLPMTHVHTPTALADRLNDPEPFVADEDYLEFVESYCPHDSPTSASVLNDYLFREESSADIQEYSASDADREWTVYFMPNLALDSDRQGFEALLNEESGENRLYVFNQGRFSQETNDVLRGVDRRATKYIIVCYAMNVTLGDILARKANRKFGLFRDRMQRLYTEEAQRILPGIRVKKYVNLSNERWFGDIAKLARVSTD